MKPNKKIPPWCLLFFLFSLALLLLLLLVSVFRWQWDGGGMAGWRGLFAVRGVWARATPPPSVFCSNAHPNGCGVMYGKPRLTTPHHHTSYQIFHANTRQATAAAKGTGVERAFAQRRSWRGEMAKFRARFVHRGSAEAALAMWP